MELIKNVKIINREQRIFDIKVLLWSKIDSYFFMYQKLIVTMPSFKSLCPLEVQLIEPQFLTLTGHHYKIQIWSGTTEKLGAGGEVMSSNQDSNLKYCGFFSS